MAVRSLAVPSTRAASMRAEEAWLNEIDIAPPHLLDSKADQAVRMVVIESRTTAISS